MTLNAYQKMAMSTKMDSCDNDAYMVTGLVGEVGELAGKIAKAIRKGIIRIHNNRIVMTPGTPVEVFMEFKKEVMYELGDVLWFCAGTADQLGISLDYVSEMNLAKLADRKKRNVIDGEGDHR